MLNREAIVFSSHIYYFRRERHWGEKTSVKCLLRLFSGVFSIFPYGVKGLSSHIYYFRSEPRTGEKGDVNCLFIIVLSRPARYPLNSRPIEDEELLSLRFESCKLLLLPGAARRVVGVHVGVIGPPKADEMSTARPIPGPHACNHLCAFLQSSPRGSHGFCLHKLRKSIRSGDRLEEVPRRARVFGAKTMGESICAHFHRCDVLVDPGGHDIGHTGRTTAGGADGLRRAACYRIGLLAPPRIALFVIHWLSGVGSRGFCRSSVTAIKQRQPIVCADIAGLFQTRGGLEDNYIFPGVGTILSIDRSSDQCLDNFDINAAAIVLVHHRRQGL